MTPNAERILMFWFGDQNPPSKELTKRWFSGGPELDAQIIREFSSDHELVRGGLPEDWSSKEDRLAAILLIDQLSRNMFRGDAKAFAWDGLAQQWSLEGWSKDFFHNMTDAQKAFALMPLVHSESIDLHDQAIGWFQKAIEDAASADTMLTGFLSSAQEHRAIIAEFGRYPHRNAVLGREATSAETAYLNNGAKRFGQ